MNRHEINLEEELKMRFVSPEDNEPKVCERCKGRNVYSTTPQDLIGGLCPECAKQSKFR